MDDSTGQDSIRSSKNVNESCINTVKHGREDFSGMVEGTPSSSATVEAPASSATNNRMAMTNGIKLDGRQVEMLQLQVQQFKQLSGRFNEIIPPSLRRTTHSSDGDSQHKSASQPPPQQPQLQQQQQQLLLQQQHFQLMHQQQQQKQIHAQVQQQQQQLQQQQLHRVQQQQQQKQQDQQQFSRSNSRPQDPSQLQLTTEQQQHQLLQQKHQMLQQQQRLQQQQQMVQQAASVPFNTSNQRTAQPNVLPNGFPMSQQQQEQNRAIVATGSSLSANLNGGKPLSAYMVKKKLKESEQQPQQSFLIQQQTQQQQPMQQATHIQQPQSYNISNNYPVQSMGNKQPINQQNIPSQQQYRTAAPQGLQFPPQLSNYPPGQMQYAQVPVQQQQQFNQSLQTQYIAQLPQQVGSNQYPQQAYYSVQPQQLQQQQQQYQQQQQRQPNAQTYIPQQTGAQLQHRGTYSGGNVATNPIANSMSATQAAANSARQFQQGQPQSQPRYYSAPSNVPVNAQNLGAARPSMAGQSQYSSTTKNVPVATAVAVPPRPKCLPPAEAAFTVEIATPASAEKIKSTWSAQQAILKHSVFPVASPAQPAVVANYFKAGPFVQSSAAPFVLTHPYVRHLREVMLKKLVAIPPPPSSTSVETESEENSDEPNAVVSASPTSQCVPDASRQKLLLKLQREARAKLLKSFVETAKKASIRIHPIESINADNYMQSHSCYLLPYKQQIRTRKQSVRDVKLFEKIDRKKKNETEDRRRRKWHEFHKLILSQRDDFLRFHKSRRADWVKVAKQAKLLVDSHDFKKEKDEQRAEMRRLQALKENDMEAYNQLVQETKNSRLKFLLNQTDTYINTINQLIQDQRVNEAALVQDSVPNPALLIGDMSGGKITKASKEYYQSTHRNFEAVSQPAMLKGGDLKEYQMSGLQWLVSLYNNNLNGILADEMGLGKTIQTIALLSYLMEFKHNNGPFLIVVPLSTLSNWVNEFNKWAPGILKVVYKGYPDERKRIFKEDVENGQLNVLITTYEYTMRDKSSLKRLTWQYIIVDEGHRMKNANSKFAQTLGTNYSSKHRILLTGTPLQNNLPELWALLNFLLPTIFSSVDTFDQWFNKPFAAFRVQGGPAAAATGDEEENAVLTQEERLLIVHRLHEVLRPFMLRRVKDQVLDQLPEKVERVLKCNLSGWQRKMYQSIANKGLAIKDKDIKESGGLNNVIMQLRKVCNHPYLFLKDYVIDESMIRCSGKFELLDRMLPKLKAAGHRVLLFSQMVELMDFLEQFFLMRGFKYLRLDGNTSSDEREKRMYMFNDPDSPYFIFLLSTRAGGLGLNLATADTVIIFDSDWNPMMDAQAQDRAHRIGQKNEVRVFRLLTASPIEERILARATDKKNLTGLVVEAGKFNQQQVPESGKGDEEENVEDKEMVTSLLNEWSAGGTNALSLNIGESEAQKEDGEEEDGDIPDDEQINSMMASYDGEMEMYQMMDAERERSRKAWWGSQPSAGKGTSLPPQPSRLTQAWELPIWLTEQCWPKKYSTIMEDMMNVNIHWQPGSVPIKATHGAVGRPKNAPVVSFEEDEDNGDFEDPSQRQYTRDGEGAASGANTLSLRKRKEAVIYDDGMSDIQFQKYVEKQFVDGDVSANVMKKVKSEKGSATAAVSMSELCKSVLAVVSAIMKVKKSDGQKLCFWFFEKPNRKTVPEYYLQIREPISLKEIVAKLKTMEYQYLEQVYLDFALMSNNARVFNLDDSPIFHDSEMIRQEFFKRTLSIRKPFLKKHPYLEPFPQLPVTGYTVYTKFVISLVEDGNGNETSESFEDNVKPAKKKSKSAVDDWDGNNAAPMSENKKRKSISGSTPVSKVDYSGHEIGEPILKLSLSLKKPVVATAVATSNSGRKASKRKLEND